MKLWYLYLTDLGHKEIGGYDMPMGYVVRAETEERARKLTGFNKPEYATCTELTYEGEAGVIICDFHEG